MSKQSSSIVNDVVGTFAAVSVVAYLLSLTLDESTPQPLAQSPDTHQAMPVSAVAYFSANNQTNVDINQLHGCSLIGINQDKAIVTLDCSKGHVNGVNSGADTASGGQQI